VLYCIPRVSSSPTTFAPGFSRSFAPGPSPLFSLLFSIIYYYRSLLFRIRLFTRSPLTCTDWALDRLRPTTATRAAPRKGQGKDSARDSTRERLLKEDAEKTPGPCNDVGGARDVRHTGGLLRAPSRSIPSAALPPANARSAVALR
jgi:hypothetical protein